MYRKNFLFPASLFENRLVRSQIPSVETISLRGNEKVSLAEFERKKGKKLMNFTG